MKELKHTKGPWDYINSEEYPNEFEIVKDEYFIAKTYDGVEGLKNSEANALLISCAPNLIEDKIKDYKEIGKWLSAALEDDNVCVEMKQDIIMWFKRFNTFEKATGLTIEEVLNDN